MFLLGSGAPTMRLMIPLTVFVSSLVAAPSEGETELIRKNLRQLSREAELVVVANVVANHAAWDEERRLIWTTTTLAVEASWKGTAPRRLRIKELGGVVGTVGMRVAGAPRYAIGERVVLFLKKDPLNQWRTHGWTQGRYGLTRGKTGTTVNALHHHVLAGFFPAPEAMGSRALDLAAFETKVRDLIRVTARRPAAGEKGGQ